MDAVTAVESLLTTQGRHDPYPLYAALHAAGPAVRLAGGYVVAHGYAAVDRVLRDPAFLVEDAEFIERVVPGWVAEHPSLRLLGDSMLKTNPPDHERMRRLVTRAFTARRVASMRASVGGRAAELAERMADTGHGQPVDFMAEFAYLLPVTVIADLLGVPEEDRPWFRPLATDLTVALEPTIDGAALATADRAAVELTGYFTGLVARRRSEPGDDLIGALVAAGGGLTPTELLANLAVLLIAGFETTTNLLGNGLVVLLGQAAQAARLRAGPVLAPAYVEELLRYDSPVQLTGRWTRADAEVSGVKVPAGGQVLVLLGAANRDPLRFTAPDRFDPARDEGGPMSFGAGAHFCVGAALARLEAQIALPLLLNRFPGLRLAGEPRRRDRLTLRGYATLPVDL